MIAQIAAGLAGPAFKLIDKLFTSDEERDQKKIEFLKMQQDGELKEMEQSMSLLLSDSKSKDSYTSRARPSYLYVMYFLFSCAVPVGVLSIFHPEAATQLAVGMGAWLGAIPEPMWDAFWICFTGYTGARTYEKTKGVAK